MKSLFLADLLLLLTLSSSLIANRDCMDNSNHLEPIGGYDYKTYHKVCCTCDCNRYARYADRGECSQCNHFRIRDSEFDELSQ